ncbi:MAG: hypothetical protein IRY83_15635, partial [Chloroflexi bacterium]|nr:hypothetical protein [Chloroflexota bacterium]
MRHRRMALALVLVAGLFASAAIAYAGTPSSGATVSTTPAATASGPGATVPSPTPAAATEKTSGGCSLCPSVTPVPCLPCKTPTPRSTPP